MNRLKSIFVLWYPVAVVLIVLSAVVALLTRRPGHRLDRCAADRVAVCRSVYSRHHLSQPRPHQPQPATAGGHYARRCRARRLRLLARRLHGSRRHVRGIGRAWWLLPVRLLVFELWSPDQRHVSTPVSRCPDSPPGIWTATRCALRTFTAARPCTCSTAATGVPSVWPRSGRSRSATGN